jgi:ribosomal protein S18 acetylase RimI-like enzyme
MTKIEHEIKPEELKDLNKEKEDYNTIEFEQMTEQSLKGIDEFHKLFPKLKRETILEKMKDTLSGQDMRFIAKKGGKIVGQLKVVLHKNHQSHVATLKGLYILPEERRQGLGLGLVEYSISKLPKNIKLITITIDFKNKETIKLYKKIGFEKYGLLEKGSQIDKEFVDNYLMKKDL